MSTPAHPLRFPLELLRALDTGDDPVVVSPLNVAAALAMVGAGARGETAAEIEAAIGGDAGAVGERLRAVLEGAGQATLTAPCRVWTAGSVLPSFAARVAEALAADAVALDPAQGNGEHAGRINAWVAERTHDEIRELVSASDLRGPLCAVLTAALYFKGEWEHPFTHRKSRQDAFYGAGGATSGVVRMLHAEPQELRYHQGDHWQLVELPYRGSSLVMTLLKPRERDETESIVQMMAANLHARSGPPELRCSLAELEASLTPELLAGWLEGMRGEEVSLSMPRMSLSFTAGLGRALKRLGIERVFDQDRCDLSRLTDDVPTWLGRVLHAVRLDVDEEGTVAAAATAAMTLAAGVSTTYCFRADHPFLLLLRDPGSGEVLFAGRITRLPDEALGSRGWWARLRDFFGRGSS